MVASRIRKRRDTQDDPEHPTPSWGDFTPEQQGRVIDRLCELIAEHAGGHEQAPPPGGARRGPIPLADLLRDARRRALGENFIDRFFAPGTLDVDLRRGARTRLAQLRALAAGTFLMETSPRSEWEASSAAAARHEDLLREPERYDLVDAYLRDVGWPYESDQAVDLELATRRHMGRSFGRWIEEDIFDLATRYQPEKATPPGEDVAGWKMARRGLWWRTQVLRRVIWWWGTFDDDTRAVHCYALAGLIPLETRRAAALRELDRRADEYRERMAALGDRLAPLSTVAARERVARDAIATAIPLVVHRACKPQRVKFGNAYAKDAGVVVAVVPLSLPWLDLWTWFMHQAQAAAEAILTGTKYPSAMSEAGRLETDVTEKAGRAKPKRAVRSADALPESVLAAELGGDALLEAATRQAATLGELAAGMFSAGFDDARLQQFAVGASAQDQKVTFLLSLGWPTADIAVELGLEVNAVYQAKGRIRKRAGAA
jgi:hypothetical protein